MLKIGVITLPLFNGRQYNFGGTLQNYALVQFLNNSGYNTKAIHTDAYSINEWLLNNIYMHFHINIFMWHNKIPAVNFAKHQKCARDKKFLSFIRDNIPHDENKYYSSRIYEKKYSQEYDFFIVGSDQVWSPLAINEKSVSKYFLSFCEEKKRISYAASLSCEAIPSEKIICYSKGISKFKAVSVREKNAKQLLEKLGVSKCNVHIDPVFLLEKSNWRSLSDKYSLPVKGKFILLYFLGSLESSMLEKLRENYKIIDLMNRNEEFYTVGPGEFLWLINNASLVLTDSFHAVSFSIIFQTPFYVFQRNQRYMNHMWSRISNLLEKFHLQERVANGFENIMDFDINYSNVDLIIEQEHKRAENYFSHNCKED